MGKDVKLDGFRWLMDEEAFSIFPETKPSPSLNSLENLEACAKPKGYQDIKKASFYEPRIEFIMKTLEQLLSLVDLEKNGQVVKVDGFRLKNLRD